MRAGFTAAEALRAATLRPAEFFGASHRLGTVAAGKIADDLVDAAYLTAKENGLLNGEGGITVDVDKNNVAGMDKVIEKLLKDKP